MSQYTPKERFKKLESFACEFQVDKNIPIKRYFRSGVEMLRMADTYYDEENYEKSYILYHKYVTLFIEKLKLHPGYKSISASEKTPVIKNVKDVLTRLEKLKANLREKFEDEFAVYLEEEEQRAAEKAEYEEKMAKLKLQDEENRLKQHVHKYHDEKERELAIQRDRELAIWHQLQIDKELRDEEEAARANFRPGPVGAQHLPIRPGGPQPHSADNSPRHEASKQPPSVDRASKPEPAKGPTGPFIPDRSTKPSSSLYSSGNLRTVTVPTMLMVKFLSLSDKNTKANVETCGILAGKLAQNSFRITHLLIPKQTGTSDSCVTEGEEAIFEYQDSHDLITLGWIHTHPSQTAFLSSVDLHTQLSYQLMLPEAIAIVVSPKFNETAYLALTSNYGLDYVGNCRQTGFHPHPNEPPLFETAGHIQLDDATDVILADLRK